MQSYVVLTIIGTMNSSDSLQHISLHFGLPYRFDYPTLWTRISVLYTNRAGYCRVSPVPFKHCVNIPLPLRRERTTLHFQILHVVYCLHHTSSGSTFLVVLRLRRSSIHFMLRTANLPH